MEHKHDEVNSEAELSLKDKQAIASVVIFVISVITLSGLIGKLIALYPFLKPLMILPTMCMPFLAVYWLVYSKSGPGVDKLIEIGKAALQPIANIPEKKRFVFLLPFFTVALLYCLSSISWVVFSDEASQKRDLFNVRDTTSTMKWFHNGDSIDIYTFSETLNTLYEDKLPPTPSDLVVGVKIRYQDDLAKLTGKEFQNMVVNDYRQIRAGKIYNVSGDAQIGTYKKDWHELSFMHFNGAFGMNGHDPFTMLVILLSLFFFLIYFLTKKVTSPILLAATVFLSIFGAMPSVMSPNEALKPTLVSVFAEN